MLILVDFVRVSDVPMVRNTLGGSRFVRVHGGRVL